MSDGSDDDATDPRKCTCEEPVIETLMVGDTAVGYCDVCGGDP